MKLLYIDCSMGAAGDMLTAALYDLLEDKEGYLDELDRLGIPGVTFRAGQTQKCGITGTRMVVQVNEAEEGEAEDEHGHAHEHEHGHGHEHAHSHHHSRDLHDIRHIIMSLDTSESVKQKASSVYDTITKAEAAVHGKEVDLVHFHEVGALDAVADVTAVCLAIEKLAPDRIIFSPVNTGSGTVRCAHGVLPVPAPATANILVDVPVYSDGIQGELCTPTGAALIKAFADGFGELPPMKLLAVSYGMGKKDFERPNCVRAMLGETDEASDAVTELRFNVDDMTGEQLAFASEMFFEGGALDVYTIPIGMKKGRPGTLMSVMCRENDRDKLIKLIFRHTSTIGVRETQSKRHVLNRRETVVPTRFGDIRVKVSEGCGVRKQKAEFEDLARAAKERGISLGEVASEIPD